MEAFDLMTDDELEDEEIVCPAAQQNPAKLNTDI